MTELFFYHLTTSTLESALPKLLEKSLQVGFRSVVTCQSEAIREMLNQLLWTYDPNSFLPHGSEPDGNVELQPVYLTCHLENPNQANMLAVTDGRTIEDFGNFQRVLDIFEGNNPDAVAQARTRWKHYTALGHTVAYRKQDVNGSWTTA